MEEKNVFFSIFFHVISNGICCTKKTFLCWLLSNNVITRLNSPFVIILVISFLSCWNVGTTNIGIEMTSIPMEHFIWLESGVIHIEEWQHVRHAKPIPKAAKNDIARSQHRLQRMYVPSILDVTTSILHIGCTGCFLFVSLWLYLLFCFVFSSNRELWHKRTMFPLSITRLLDKVFLKNAAS